LAARSTSYTIASSPGSLSGTYFNLPNTGDIVGLQRLILLHQFGSGSGSFITLTAVPEPSQVIAIGLLLVLGLWFGHGA